MVQLDLRTFVQENPLDTANWPQLAPETLRAAQTTWRGRMVNEHISAQVFAGLLPQLMRAGISAQRQAAIADMIADELRHARQCAQVLAGLGGEALAALPDLQNMPDHGDVQPLEAALRNVLSVCCLSETIAVALIQAERCEVDIPEIAEILRQILGDESQHARFGWTLLEECRDSIDPGMRKRLDAYLRLAFAHVEQHELRYLSPLSRDDAAGASVGVCDGAQARELFYATVNEVIVPQLARHGFAAHQAWAHRSSAN